MVVILGSESIVCVDGCLVEELVIDTRDWFLQKEGGDNILANVHESERIYYLTMQGYNLVKDAIIRGDH